MTIRFNSGWMRALPARRQTYGYHDIKRFNRLELLNERRVAKFICCGRVPLAGMSKSRS
jgi:hypothetical protein